MIKKLIDKLIYSKVNRLIKSKNKEFFIIGYMARYDLDIRYHLNCYYVNDMGRLDNFTLYFTKSIIFRILMYLNKLFNKETQLQTIRGINYINDSCERKTINAIYQSGISGGITEHVSYDIIYEDNKFIITDNLRLIDKLYLTNIKLDYTSKNLDIIENL